MSIYHKLSDLNIIIPELTAPAAAFVPYVQTGNLIYLSGHILKSDGKPLVGQLGVDITTAQGKKAARAVAVDLLGTLNAAVRNLDRPSALLSWSFW